MKRLIFLAALLLSTTIHAQIVLDYAEFQGKFTTTIRDALVVPTGGALWGWNFTTQQFEYAADDQVWKPMTGIIADGNYVAFSVASGVATMNSNSVPASALQANAVTGPAIADNSVGSSDIINGTVQPADMANMAQHEVLTRLTAGSGTPVYTGLATVLAALYPNLATDGTSYVTLSGIQTISGTKTFGGSNTFNNTNFFTGARTFFRNADFAQLQFENTSTLDTLRIGVASDDAQFRAGQGVGFNFYVNDYVSGGSPFTYPILDITPAGDVLWRSPTGATSTWRNPAGTRYMRSYWSDDDNFYFDPSGTGNGWRYDFVSEGWFLPSNLDFSPATVDPPDLNYTGTPSTGHLLTYNGASQFSWTDPSTLGGGSGTVNTTGTPSVGQAAEFSSGTAITGVAVTGTGQYVKGISPTLVTPNLGTPSALVLTNATGLPTAGIVDGAVTPAKVAISGTYNWTGTHTFNIFKVGALSLPQIQYNTGTTGAELGFEVSPSVTWLLRATTAGITFNGNQLYQNASQVPYTNTTSGLSATTTQGAVDEIVAESSQLGEMAKTADFIAALSDAQGLVNMNNTIAGTPKTITIPANTGVPFPVGTVLTFRSDGVGDWTVSYAGGVTGPAARTYKQGDIITLWKTATDTWKTINNPVDDVEVMVISLTSPSGNMVAGTSIEEIRTFEDMYLVGIYAEVKTAGTGTAITVIDVNEDGTSVLGAIKLQIDNTEKSTLTAATPTTITDTFIDALSYITFDVDQISDTAAAKGCKIYIEYIKGGN